MSMRPVALTALALLASAAPAHASFYGKKNVTLPAVGGQGDGPVAPEDIDVIENLGQNVPRGLVFSDGRGQRVALDDLLGKDKPVLLTLGYYHCPMLCNLVHEGLVKALKRTDLVAGRDFLGLAVSIDPNEDPKSANTQQGRLLRALAHENKADWTFVFDTSPEAAAAKALADAVGFRYKYDPQSKQFAHSAVAILLSPGGKIVRYVYGVDFQPRDLRLAVVEASEGRVGTSLDRVLLACFRYDPMARRYTPYGAAFVRIGAGLSAATLLLLLGILWRKELIMRRSRAPLPPPGSVRGSGRAA